MKASVFVEKNKIEVCEVTLPPLGDNDVLIKVMACGVCGTDIHVFNGEAGSADVTPPVVLGHEFSGVIEQIGSKVEIVAVGDRVTVDPNMYCGVCKHCRTGKKQMCGSMKAIGVTQDGGFAEYCVVPASQAVKMAPDTDFEAGAMGEALACCIHGIDLAEIKAGDIVLVIGGGPIGLMVIQLAKLQGASKVILSEPVAMRRDVALSLGADAVIDPITDDPATALREITGASGADVVIECVGNVKATSQAFDCADKGAIIVLFSVPHVDAKFELPLFDMFCKELTVKGSFVNPNTHSRAVELLNAGRIQIAPIISHRYPLEQLEEAVKMQVSSESLKVLVVPGMR